MKVILRQDVENLGKMGELANVKNGYARNYLIPRGLAYFADEKALRRLEVEKKQFAARQEKLKGQAQELAAKLADVQLSLAMQVGEENRIFGTITNQMIAEKLVEKGFEIDKRNITIDEPIKSLGVFDAKVKLHPEVSANLKIWVISQD